MQQLWSVWQTLDPRRRVIAISATAAMFLAVVAMATVASRPSMSLLYAGIEGASAGEVIAALEQAGVAHEVRGDAIYVDAGRRDALRMELAAKGLPAIDGTGYELLDSLTGFGTTSQMFDAAYWRAKEGELARTIAAMPGMGAVRVHIARSEPQGFGAAPRPSASVALLGRTGGVAPGQARALRYLVAAAVTGLAPGDVAVIDGAGRLVAAEGEDAPAGTDERTAALRANVLRILEARVGPGHAVVEVTIDTVTETEAITERSIDPESRVAISSVSEEQASSATDSGSAPVTVASNLPTGDAAAAGKSSQSSDSQTRTTTNYEISETRREVTRAPGAIRRLTVAVLVDGVAATDGDGEAAMRPRDDDELAALRELVVAAAGIDETRGDVVTVRSMPFEPATAGVEVEGPGLLAGFGLDVMAVVQAGVLAVVAIVLGLFVVRPILAPRQLPAPVRAPALRAAGPVLTGVIDDPDRTAAGAAAPGPDGRIPAPARAAHDVLDPVARLRQLVRERQEATLDILKDWMDEPNEERA